jgi:predicted methyltransferase
MSTVQERCQNAVLDKVVPDVLKAINEDQAVWRFKRHHVMSGRMTLKDALRKVGAEAWDEGHIILDVTFITG